MSTPDVLAGAEAWSHDGGPHGALVLHGFTGNPTSMRPLADAFAAAGFTVELPRLPGHGTTVEDMLTTDFTDWSAAVDAAYERLAARCEKVVVAGLSMGGTLTLWTAIRHPEVAGIICVNPAAQPDDGMRGLITSMVDGGDELMPGIGSDVADPDVVESAYDQVPLRPLLSMFDAVDELQAGLGAATCPLLLCTSAQDHVVPPANSDHLAAAWGGTVERLPLEQSFHVATIDHDRDLIAERAVAFAQRVCG